MALDGSHTASPPRQAIGEGRWGSTDVAASHVSTLEMPSTILLSARPAPHNVQLFRSGVCGVAQALRLVRSFLARPPHPVFFLARSRCATVVLRASRFGRHARVLRCCMSSCPAASRHL